MDGMEGIEDTSTASENDMSFELTGPAVLVPFHNNAFNPPYKRTFYTFSDDDTFEPAEQFDRPVGTECLYQHVPTIDTDTLGQQEISWMQWGILRSFQAIHFTSVLLQAIVAIAAAVPMAAAKKRLVSIDQHITAPTPVRRTSSSRRSPPRLFRQNHSPSTGQRSTSPITPPRFRPTPLSPFHVPGTYPPSPPKTPSSLPVASTPPPPNHTSDFNGSPIGAVNAFVHTNDSTATNPAGDAMVSQDTNSTATNSAGDAMVLEDVVDDSTDLSEDDAMDETWPPPYEPLSPLKVSTDPPVLTAHQLASITELKSIQKMFQVDSPAHVATRQITPDFSTHTTTTNPSGSENLHKPGTSSQHPPVKQHQTLRELADTMRASREASERQATASGGLIESTRSPPQTLEQPQTEIDPSSMPTQPNLLAQQLAQSVQSSSQTAAQQLSMAESLTESTQSLTDISERQPSESGGLIESTRSPPQNLGLHSSENGGLTGSTQSSLQTPGLHSSDNSGLIESTRSPLQTLDEMIESMRPPPPTLELQSSVNAGLVEPMQSLSQTPGLHSSDNSGLIESTRSPPQTLGLHSSENGALIESTPSLPENPGLHSSENGELIESTRSPPQTLDELIESMRPPSDVSSHQSPNPEGSISLSDSSRHQGKLSTILKASISDIPEKGRISQLLAKLKKKQNARSSPLREIFNKANMMPKTPINKNARFLENPVTRTRKYIKGEAMTYPSPHSSRDGSSMLSQTPSLVVSDLSPTQQEQEAMIADQLMEYTSSPLPQTVGGGCPGWHNALDSSPAIENEDSESTLSELDGSLEYSPVHKDQFHAISAAIENTEPTTPQQNITDQFQDLHVSVRRSSRRTQEKDDLAEKRRLEAEAIAAEEQARKDKAAAEEKARKDKAEAEEKARKERAEAEEKARKERAEAEEKARKQAEEEKEREKKKLRMPIGKVIEPLTQEWENKVAAALALAQSKTIGHTSSGGPITRRDIGKVLPQRGAGDSASGWLNDTIIDAYLQNVVDHGNQAAGHKRGETPKFHAFSNFFYNNLKDKGAENVKRWAKRAKIAGKDLLKVEWVFIPINLHESHWTLIAVSPTRRTIEYYDSFHGTVTHQVSNIKAWLKSELGRDYKAAEWTVVEDPAAPGRGKGPRQSNGSDCGVFTVTTAKMISLGVDPMAYSASDMPTQRKRLVAELIHGGFTDDFAPNIKFE